MATETATGTGMAMAMATGTVPATGTAEVTVGTDRICGPRISLLRLPWPETGATRKAQ
jgi:hypothetical protein